jgi:hypothetical protein
MTILILGTAPAGQPFAAGFVSPPPTKWKRPCPTCGGKGLCGGVEYGGVTVWHCHTCWTDGLQKSDGTITVPLTCQTCGGRGELDHGGYNLHYRPEFHPCPDCVDGHPIIEWEGQRVSVEAVPIDHDQVFRGRPSIIVTSPPMLNQMPPRYWDGDRMVGEVTLPDTAKVGEYAIVGRPA